MKLVYIISILLLEIGFGITFNIVGTISLSELALVASAFLYIRKDLYVKYPALNAITLLYVGLLLSQILSEIVIGNLMNNALKGFAVTTVSYLHFIFLFSLFVKNREFVIYAIIGMLVNSLIFGTQFEGDISEVVKGEGAAFLKFYLAPIIINIVLILSIYSRKRLASIICIFIGLVIIILGARNSGLTILLAGLIVYFIMFYRKRLATGRLLVFALLVGLLSYGMYTVYVNNVLKGKISAGNSEQLKSLKNPYDPLNLLIIGRTETFVGWMAFMDNPMFGHGAWAEDYGGKYRIMQLKFKDADVNQFDNALNIIPSHSVLIGAGMQNGIFAIFFMGSILFFFLKKGIKSINRKDPYIVISVFFIFFIFWNGLFSPVSHFRLTLPLSFAFLLASYSITERKKQFFKKKLLQKTNNK